MSPPRHSRTLVALVALVAVTAIAALAFLGFRVVMLEKRVLDLSHSVGQGPSGPRREKAEPTTTRPTSNLSDRVQSLESRVALLARQSQMAAQLPPAPEDKKEEVLSILADETDRILSKQLDWHRQNLMTARKPGFQAFSRTAGLSESQSSQVWEHLEVEATELVNLFRIPEVREDPTVLVREIQVVLRATDDRVRRILDDAQMKAYSAGREFEQASLMPWLQATPLKQP